ncbi:MAG: SRPBCC family protein [Gemmatimonadaceae bacterium]
MTRFIKAKRDKVFQAWIRPEIIKQWMGPFDVTVVSATTDPHVGGRYRIEMEGKGGTMGKAGATYIVNGVYEEIVSNEKLVFTWVWERPDPVRTVVTVLLKDQDAGTELTLIHERFATAEDMKSHEHGWEGSMEKLARAVE